MKVQPRSDLRLGYVDVIKGLVVAGVIVAHAGMTYGLFGNWPYQETVHALPLPIGYAVAFVTMLGMGMLFFVAGLFTPSAMQRKGGSRFVGDRLIRLGIPTLVYLLMVIPAVNFLGRLAEGTDAASSAAFARDRLVRGDLGSMWFVFALLLVTLGYAGWSALGPKPPAVLKTWHLLLVAAISALATFLVRVVQPVDDPAPINAAGWPPDFMLFVLGALAGGGWLGKVPASVMRRLPLLLGGGLVLLVPLAFAPGLNFSSLLGGWHWESAAVSASESLVTIGLTLWIFRQFQRIPSDPLPGVTHGSFVAYLLQTPVLVLIGIAMRPVALPAELKALVLAVLGLPVCFGLAAGYRKWKRGRRVMRPKAPEVASGLA